MKTEAPLPKKNTNTAAINEVAVSGFSFRTLVEQAPVAICVFRGDNFIFEVVNEKFLQLIGKTKEQVINKPFFSGLSELVGQGHEALISGVYKTGIPFNINESPVPLIRNGKEEIIYANFIYEPLYDGEHKIDGVFAVVTEVTEQVEARNKIEESEALSRSTFESSPDCVKVIDTEGRLTYMNFNGLCTMEIDDFNEIKNKPWWSLWGKENEQAIREAVAKSLNGETAQFQAMCPTAKGTNKWWDVMVSPIVKPDGKISQLISVSRDITSEVEQRKQIEESEVKYRTLFNSIDQGFLLGELIRNKEGKGIDYYVHQVNTTYEKQTGISVEMVLGKTFLQAFPTVDTWWIDTYAAVVDNQWPVRFERFFEFTNRWFEIKASPNEQDMFTILFTDISERKQAEVKLKQSELRFHELIYSSPSLMAILKGEDMIIEIANDAVLTSWAKGEDVIGKSIFLVLPEVVEQGFDKLLLNVYETGEPYQAYESPVTLLRNGINELIYYNFVYQAQRNINGEIEGVAILANEVTPQALLNKKIQASEEKFKRLVLQAPVAICVLRGENYLIETINEGMFEMWDRTLEQALNKPAFDVLPELKEQGFKEILDNVYKTGERFVANELPISLRRNGKLENAFVKFVYEPLRESDGTVSGVMALAHEITEQVLARKKVEESEKKFEAAILAVEGIIWTNNANGEMMGEQPGWTNLTGQTLDEYQGYGWTKAIHTDDIQPTINAWNNAVATNSTFEFEHRVKTAQNEWKLFSVKAVPAFDEIGAIQQWVGVHTDITEQKLAQEKLAYRTALLEAHNEASIDGILLVDAKGKILSFNQRFVEIWNMPQQVVNDKDDVAALSFAMSQLVNPQQFIDKVKYLYEHPTETSFDEMELKNGKILERNGYSVVGEDGMYYAWSWIFKDITDRKRIEKDLKNIKEQLELTFKNIPAGVYLISAKGEMVYVNDRGAAIYGDFTPEYMLEHNDLSTQLKIADELFERFDENGNYFSAQDSPAYISLTTGKPSQAILKQINKVTRQQRWYYVQGAPLFDESGNVTLVLITSTDITEQKNAEEKIKYSEERFRSLAETLPQMVWVRDGDGRIEYGSKNWKEYSGIDDVAEAWDYMMHPDDRERLTAYWNQVFALGKGYQHEVRLKNKEGIYRWFYSVGEPVLNADEKAVKWVGSLTDIHEQKNIEQKLEVQVAARTEELEHKNIELQKMNKELEAFTYISSHDLQEPLRKIQTFAGRIIATEKENLSENAKEYFRRMNDAAERMRILIQDLLSFSLVNSSERKFEITNLGKIVEEVKYEFEDTLAEKQATIEVKKMFELSIIPFQFRQLMQNLISNALKFSKPNTPPHIIIDSKMIPAANSPFEGREACLISISDNGIGFEKEYTQKIFQVFQRLHGKDEYAGTGIGLAIVKKIVDNHNGVINAESELGKGATFNIYIPL